MMKEALDNEKLLKLIGEFRLSYKTACETWPNRDAVMAAFDVMVQLVIEQARHPHSFSIFHKSVREPFDYYQFGIDFIRPFIDFDRSRVFGKKIVKEIEKQLANGESVIFLANHQTEPDPQIISLLLEKIAPQLATAIIFVAGHRVVTDPIAIPMSLGCNLLCIYSKKHIHHPPEQRGEKILHNQRTLKQMLELLNEGGKCIYVAPSGGRDRRDVKGIVQVTPFDPQSVELFWLLAQQAERPVHFYPLALRTFDLMPPPKQVEVELGERRIIHKTAVFLAFGEKIEMERFAESEQLDKQSKRARRAEWIWQQVKKMHDHLS